MCCQNIIALALFILVTKKKTRRSQYILSLIFSPLLVPPRHSLKALTVFSFQNFGNEPYIISLINYESPPPTQTVECTCKASGSLKTLKVHISYHSLPFCRIWIQREVNTLRESPVQSGPCYLEFNRNLKFEKFKQTKLEIKNSFHFHFPLTTKKKKKRNTIEISNNFKTIDYKCLRW